MRRMQQELLLLLLLLFRENIGSSSSNNKNSCLSGSRVEPVRVSLSVYSLFLFLSIQSVSVDTIALSPVFWFRVTSLHTPFRQKKRRMEREEERRCFGMRRREREVRENGIDPLAAKE